ncbi:hypothetical protein [Kitasatospora sp. NPDC005751]|uniref:hypothetical protein n=1 Tax=unclassified Kitasatospora TaxID=2633591 RepID=UPI0033C9B433
MGCALVAMVGGTALACPTDDPAPSAEPAVAAAKPSDSDLEVIRLDPDPVAPGGTTTLHAFIANDGPDRTASAFTVVITLPEGVTAEAPFFPDNCYEFQNGHRVRCTFPAGLKRYRTATALIPLRVASTVPLGDLDGGYVAVRSDDDRNEANNRQPFTVHVVESTRG